MQKHHRAILFPAVNLKFFQWNEINLKTQIFEQIQIEWFKTYMFTSRNYNATHNQINYIHFFAAKKYIWGENFEVEIFLC